MEIFIPITLLRSCTTIVALHISIIASVAHSRNVLISVASVQLKFHISQQQWSVELTFLSLHDVCGEYPVTHNFHKKHHVDLRALRFPLPITSICNFLPKSILFTPLQLHFILIFLSSYAHSNSVTSFYCMQVQPPLTLTLAPTNPYPNPNLNPSPNPNPNPNADKTVFRWISHQYHLFGTNYWSEMQIKNCQSS